MVNKVSIGVLALAVFPASQAGKLVLKNGLAVFLLFGSIFLKGNTMSLKSVLSILIGAIAIAASSNAAAYVYVPPSKSVNVKYVLKKYVNVTFDGKLSYREADAQADKYAQSALRIPMERVHREVKCQMPDGGPSYFDYRAACYRVLHMAGRWHVRYSIYYRVYY